MNELVFIEGDRLLTDSITIAESFNKAHKNVIRDIQTLDSSEEFNRLNFEQVEYQDSKNRTYKKYLITQDGFSFLVMGYTGKGAARFKELYISEFNRMREQLQFKLPTSYKQALTQLLEQVEENEQLNTKNLVLTQQNSELKPKASYYDMVLQNKSLLSVSKIAKDYGMSAIAFNKKLKQLGVQFKQGDIWLLYAKYQDKGYTQTSTHVIDADKSKVSTKWTQKGRLFIYDLMKREGIYPIIEREESA